jgi:hypothetical protein
MTRSTGAQFEIQIDGKPRTYRDMMVTAIEAGENLKALHPQSEVTVKDLESGGVTAVAFKTPNVLQSLNKVGRPAVTARARKAK